MIINKKQIPQIQKLGVVLVLFLWATTSILAQKETNYTDSDIEVLKQRLKTAETDSERAQLAIDVSTIYSSLEELDSCRIYARVALRFTRNIPNQNKIKKMKARALENLGFGLAYQNPRNGLDTLLMAQELWKELKDDNGIGRTHYSIGITLSNIGEFPQAIEALEKSLFIFEKTGDKKGLALSWFYLSLTQRYMGYNGDALENSIQSLKLAREIKDTLLITATLLSNGFNYLYVGEFIEAKKAQEEALALSIQIKDSVGISTVYNDLAVTAEESGNLDEALKYHLSALELRKKLHDDSGIGSSYGYIANILILQGKLSEALVNAKESLKYTKKSGDFRFIMQSYIDIGLIYVELKDYDNAINNYKYAFEMAQDKKSIDMQVFSLIHIGEALRLSGNTKRAQDTLEKADKIVLPSDFFLRSRIYKEIVATFESQNDYKNAFENQLIYQQFNDSLLVAQKTEKITQLTQKLVFENKNALQKASQDKEIAIKESQIKQQKFIRNLSILGLIVGVVISFILYRKFKEKRKLNEVLHETLNNLKATQGQLIQSEKMASLGELTAGIAHEIQNPLNFVNNFSEVSNELMDEMNEELDKGDIDEAKDISIDIKQNLEKINHHGKRADAIVKGMLQHSRRSTGKKEPTDINKLADEYLRLAYHGLRAKDKSFNATMETDYDENIDMINVIPQEMGRVILNLITNAFYAVNERKNTSEDGDYKPTVSVATKKVKDQVIISVKDNGNGVPKHVIDKIFQPFFTTKPTGKGTGLGLSMSYDIVTKGHNGKLLVDTSEGKGASFTIKLTTL